MSLCLDHGHPEARHYPLGMLYDEAILIEERETSRITTEATLRQSLLGGLFARKGSKGKSAFSKDAKRISVRTKPRRAAFE